MDQEQEFIEFEILQPDKLSELERLTDLINETKNKGLKKADNYWLEQFPNHALRHFFFGENDNKPNFETSDDTGETWHFYSLIDYLQGAEIGGLRIDQNNGRGILRFQAYCYPYGGISGLIMLLRSFDCVATKMNEGAGLYEINWSSESLFTVNEIKGN